MSEWNTVLQDIKKRYPLLTQLHVYGEEQHSSTVPEALQASIAIAENILEEEADHKRLAMIFPVLLDCPEWIAICCSLIAINRDFSSAIESMADFKRGQKLLLDDHCVVEYVKREKIDGTSFLWMKMGAKSKAGQKPKDTTKTFNVNEWLRFQPADTKRPLTPIENLDLHPPGHPLDQLLGINSFGNRSIFQNRILLVSRLAKVRQFAEHATIYNPCLPEEPIQLRDLFQWGGITEEGELDQWGHQQVKAEPVLGVAPDLITLREYLSNHQPSETLIILDTRLPFANDLQALDELLDEGYPIFALMENRHSDDLKYLEERSFRTWAWSDQELGQFELAERYDLKNRKMPFRHFHRSVQNFSARSVKETVCDYSGLDSAFEKLHLYSKQRRSDDPELVMIEGRFYQCLLNLARLLRPLGMEGAAHRDKNLKTLIEQAKADIADKAMWLEEDAMATALEFIEDITTLISNIDRMPDKVMELQELLDSTKKNSQRTIVLSEASEVPHTESYWDEKFPLQQNVEFVTASSLDFDKDCDQLIVCGWLGANRMRELFDSCIAPSITVLMHPFEQKWLRSALRRWERSDQRELSVLQKANMLRTTLQNMPGEGQSEGGRKPAAVSQTEFDIVEFEIRLNIYRRALYARPSVSGETTMARFVAFSQDTYSYFRPNHKVPVVTDLITGHASESAEVRPADISQLKVGDYVIFREGSNSDLLRDLADRALARVGKGEHRAVAGLWKKALKHFVDFHPQGFDRALRELRKGGLKRSDITIRNWMNNEHTIGPQRHQDLDIIAQVSGDKELQTRVEYVHRAIKEVRGAHHQAGDFLAKRLIAQLPSLLQAGFDEANMIEIEDVGSALVVRVEDIGDEDIEVAILEVNCLLEGKF